jgi:hypothetical protein
MNTKRLNGKERFVVRRLDAVKGDSYWSSRTGRWVSELDGGYQTYGSQKVATRVAGKRATVGWDNVDVVQDPAQTRKAEPPDDPLGMMASLRAIQRSGSKTELQGVVK